MTLDEIMALILEEEKDADNLLRESPRYYAASKQQGEFTIEDYYALPDDDRKELIDGVFYDMSSPSSTHQIICTEICSVFRDFIKKRKGDCITIVAPLDVQLDCDDKTIVQPDVLIVCDRSKFKNRVIYGAPDLVVEILSPSTKRKDNFLKLSKYEKAGVREYWIVDPDKKRVLVYDFMNEDAELVEMYTFEDTIPVKIFENKCSVNFKEIYEYIEFLYETN